LRVEHVFERAVEAVLSLSVVRSSPMRTNGGENEQLVSQRIDGGGDRAARAEQCGQGRRHRRLRVLEHNRSRANTLFASPILPYHRLWQVSRSLTETAISHSVITAARIRTARAKGDLQGQSRLHAQHGNQLEHAWRAPAQRSDKNPVCDQRRRPSYPQSRFTAHSAVFLRTRVRSNQRRRLEGRPGVLRPR